MVAGSNPETIAVFLEVKLRRALFCDASSIFEMKKNLPEGTSHTSFYKMNEVDKEYLAVTFTSNEDCGKPLEHPQDSRINATTRVRPTVFVTKKNSDEYGTMRISQDVTKLTYEYEKKHGAGQISLLSSGSVNDEHHEQASDQVYDEALDARLTLDHKHRAA